MTGTTVPPISDYGRSQEALWEEPESSLGGTGVPVELIEELIDEPIERRETLPAAVKSSFSDDELNTEFHGWYLQYPKRVGSKAAEKAYRTIRLQKLATADELLQGVMRYAAERDTERDPAQRQRFTAHPATWLNQHRWKDEMAKPNNQKSQSLSGTGRGTFLDIALRQAERLERTL